MPPRLSSRWISVIGGEVLKGAADGKRYPSAWPHQPAGRSFRITMLGPRNLQFFIYDGSHLITRTDETFSAGGARWTDLIWTPAHPDGRIAWCVCGADPLVRMER